MKKALDKIFNLIRFDKKYVFFSLIIVLSGIIFGSIFIVIINKNDKTLVIEYINQFINSIKSNDFNYISTLISTLLTNNIIIIIMIILGISCILVPINILILFYKSFIIGFSLSGFILAFKLKGLIISIVYIFPHLILNILILCILTAFTLKLSINLIKTTVRRKKCNLNLYLKKYIYVIILFVMLISISSLYESFIVPYILKKIIILI